MLTLTHMRPLWELAIPSKIPLFNNFFTRRLEDDLGLLRAFYKKFRDYYGLEGVDYEKIIFH